MLREAVRAGLFNSDTCVALSVSMDGFEAWRQRGFQGWPIVATVLNVKRGERVKNVCQIILAVTPGPRQPANLESFLHPIAEELKELARGISGVKIAGRDGESQVHAYVLQFTTDMPKGDKLLSAKGHNAFCLGRFRMFFGVRADRRYYYPPVNPYTKKRRFSVHGSEKTHRTAKSVAEDA